MNKYLIIVFVSFCFITSLFPQEESELFLDGATITGIAKENDNLWISTYGQGIFRYSLKDNKWSNFSTKERNLENDLFGNIAASKDFVWAGSNEGLYIYDKKKNQWRKRKFALGGEFGNWIRSLAYDEKNNELWIGRFRNLTRLDIDKQRFTDHDLTQNNNPKTNTIIAIGIDGDSLAWFGTEAGVHRYNRTKKIDDKSAWIFLSNKKGFHGDGDAVTVSEILFENQNIWFGTEEFITQQMPEFNVGGLYRFNRQNRWDKISKKSGLPANGIYSLEKTGNKIWAGLYSFDKNDKKEYGKGLVLIDRFTGISHPIDLNKTDLKSATILSMLFDGESMWIGTDNGLIKIQITNPLAKLDRPMKASDKKQQKKK